ncbi:hypothetical protein FP2506_13914 [Fulvimarina pelagi HTCC2506]|uniref:Uncharacterized protein n=1 Tax=Fulvimarina pelagi HTCC2506 TaxID=314231 RepID=Q0G4E7_9HYPH|nr:hypothetical protein FP2506_13914 [Fulvimarina pelagi HTCC2506]
MVAMGDPVTVRTERSSSVRCYSCASQIKHQGETWDRALFENTEGSRSDRRDSTDPT